MRLHSLRRKRMSAWISRFDRPSHAVRMMKPPSGGRSASTISFRRARSRFVLDAARHADVVRRRHEDQMAAGQRDDRGDARALGADRLLGDLDEDLLALLEALLDRQRRARDALAASAAAVVGARRSTRRGVAPSSRAMNSSPMSA